MAALIPVIITLFLCSPALAGSGTIQWKAEGWDPMGNEDGIRTYSIEDPKSGLLGVGGEVLLPAGAAKVVDVLLDDKHKAQWLDKFDTARTLQTVSDREFVLYGSFNMPFPISDRDFVYRYKFSWDQAAGALVVDITEATHKEAPEEDTVGVRGRVRIGRYVLQPRDGGKRTFVQVKYLADPGGFLPGFLVNYVQKKWPRNTLDGLRKQVVKPFVKDHSIITRTFLQDFRKAAGSS